MVKGQALKTGKSNISKAVRDREKGSAEDFDVADEFTRVSEFESRRNLRSASTANLVVRLVPRFQRKTLGGRAFSVAAAQAWNSMMSHVTCHIIVIVDVIQTQPQD